MTGLEPAIEVNRPVCVELAENQPSSGTRPELSVVAPCFNDSQLAREFVETVCNLLDGKVDYELVLVDDGSADDTWDVLHGLAKVNPRLRALSLSRNFGQQIAVSAGIDEARGDFVLVMDSDLQNPPDEILNLYRKALEGYDIVYAVDGTRNSAINEFTSGLFWLLMRLLVGPDIVTKQLMMRIMSRPFAKNFCRYTERSRSIFGITNDIGMKRSVLSVTNLRRHGGRSNYNFCKRMGLFLDILLGATTAPLDWTIMVGAVTCLGAAGLGTFHFLNYWRGGITEGFTTVVILITLLGGIQISLLGMIGKYLSYIYRESRLRPLYVVGRKSFRGTKRDHDLSERA